MANLVPQNEWSDVRQLEKTDVAIAGAGGTMNEQALALTARTGYLDKYTASPYRTGKVYDLNERVQLENGDIVKSTIPNNTANPNVDMTGWVRDGVFVLPEFRQGASDRPIIICLNCGC